MPFSELEFRGIVAAATVDSASNWLSYPDVMKFDPGSNTLFSLDRYTRVVNEFRPDGEHVRTFGRIGEGPGEIRNPQSYDITSRFVAILDLGNGRIAIYDRADGASVRDIQLTMPSVDLAAVGDSMLALVPGTDGAAFDLIGLDGTMLGGFGDGGFAEGMCLCLIEYLGDGRLVILRKQIPDGRLFDLYGRFLGVFAFEEVRDVLLRWGDDFLETLRAAGTAIAAGAQGRLPSGKMYVINVAAIGGLEFLVTAAPERLEEEPREVWRLDGEGRVLERYAFDRTWVGGTAASFPRIFTAGIRDASIYEYRAGN